MTICAGCGRVWTPTAADPAVSMASKGAGAWHYRCALGPGDVDTDGGGPTLLQRLLAGGARPEDADLTLLERLQARDIGAIGK